MQAGDIRWLFAYDRWATGKVLAQLGGLDEDAWSTPDRVGTRSLGAILVHQLGAAQRWRIGLQSRGEREGPRPEHEPVPSIGELLARWETEWAEVDAWMASLTDGALAYVHDGVPVWQMLAHLANHGTQHRAEAAALLTAVGRSPGELDMIYFSEELAAAVDHP
jgi:uncharacterized damage-inducible protein DinB